MQVVHSFLGVGAPEALLVGVVAVVVFGPEGLLEVLLTSPCSSLPSPRHHPLRLYAQMSFVAPVRRFPRDANPPLQRRLSRLSGLALTESVCVVENSGTYCCVLSDHIPSWQVGVRVLAAKSRFS